jgi:hypothetical protein
MTRDRMGNASIAASNEREAIREIIAVSNRHALPLVSRLAAYRATFVHKKPSCLRALLGSNRFTHC